MHSVGISRAELMAALADPLKRSIDQAESTAAAADNAEAVARMPRGSSGEGGAAEEREFAPANWSAAGALPPGQGEGGPLSEGGARAHPAAETLFNVVQRFLVEFPESDSESGRSVPGTPAFSQCAILFLSSLLLSFILASLWFPWVSHISGHVSRRFHRSP